MATRNSQSVQGVLYKRGHNVKNWKKRYFVLGADNKTVAYYSDKELRVRKGSVTVTKVFDLPDRKDKRPFRFDFIGHQDGMEDEITLCVAAQSVDEKYKWIQAVENQVDIKQVAKSIHYNLYQEQVKHDAIKHDAMSDLMGGGSDISVDGSISNFDSDSFDTSGELGMTGGSRRAANMSMPSFSMPKSSREILGAGAGNAQATAGPNTHDWIAASGSTRGKSELVTKLEKNASTLEKRASTLFGVTSTGEIKTYFSAKEGFLQMKVSIRPARWKEYYFVFDGDSRILSWYSDKEQSKMKGYMEMLVLYDIPNRPHKTPYRMEFYGVHKNQNKGYLSCSALDENDKNGWMEVLKSHVTFKNSDDFYNSGLQAVPVWQSKPSKAMKTVAQKFAYNRSEHESPASLQLRMKAAGGLIIAPLTATAILMATLVSPNRTKDTMVDQALSAFSLSKRLDIHFTPEQDERINLAVKIGIIQGDFPQAARILWEVLQEVLRDPKNKNKIHELVGKAVDLVTNIIGNKIGPPFELVDDEKELMKKGVCDALEGNMDGASEHGRKLGIRLLADKQKVNKVMSILSLYAQANLGMDPAIVEILFAQQLDVVEKLAEGDMKVDFQKVFDIAFKVKVELLQYFEKAVFLPGLMNGCGGEYNMPLMIEEQINKVADVIWDEVKFDIDTALANTINEQNVDLDPKDGRQRTTSFNMSGPFRRLSSWFLYHWMPFDKNLWTKANDPWWITFNLILCSPFASLRIFFYSTLFCSIRHDDEYQLINYIRSFKAYHFLSTGVMGMAVGCAQYIRCVNFDLGPDACKVAGPGAAVYYYVEVACFFFNVFVVWIAFWKLSRSKRVLQQERVGPDGQTLAWVNLEVSGEKVEVRNSKWEARDENQNAWGALKYLLYFDLFCFVALLVIAGGCVMYTFGFDGRDYKTADMWKLRAYLYWMRCFYGICAFPFMVFLLPFEGPLFMKMITHAKVTAYDRHGNLRLKQIRPFYLHLKISDETIVHELANPNRKTTVRETLDRDSVHEVRSGSDLALDSSTSSLHSSMDSYHNGINWSEGDLELSTDGSKDTFGVSTDGPNAGISTDLEGGEKEGAGRRKSTEESKLGGHKSIPEAQHTGDFKFAVGQVRAHRTITAFQNALNYVADESTVSGEQLMGHNYQEFQARSEEDMLEWIRVIQLNVDVETNTSGAVSYGFKEGYLMCPIMKGGMGCSMRCYAEKPQLMRRWVEVDGSRITLYPTRAGAMATRKRNGAVAPRDRSRSAMFSNTAVEMFEQQKAAEMKKQEIVSLAVHNPMYDISNADGKRTKKRHSMFSRRPGSSEGNGDDDFSTRQHVARTQAELHNTEVMI
jgi:hypothetical protein